MPAPLTNTAASQYAALIASESATSRVRSLASDIAEYCDGEPMNWLPDLAALGFAIPEGDEERDALLAKLRSAFGTVASEATSRKLAATVKLVEGDDGSELIVSFRTVKQRESK